MKIKLGMRKADVSKLCALCGGELMGEAECNIEYICTDSREADAKNLFVVTVGERVDGHDYMLSAAKNGCKAFLCQRLPSELENSRYEYAAIVVEDSIKALARISEGHVSSLNMKKVAVTGSVGKTTTKEFIYAVLNERYKTHKTKANHNSTIGMPMSMLEATDECEAAVIEMGMSGFGEIELMSNTAKPQIACITNIGSSHLELLGTRENICKAKLEIVSGMKGGKVIVNGDEPLLVGASVGENHKLTVGVDNPECRIKAFNLRYSDEGSVFDLEVDGKVYADIEINVIGKQFVYASLFAFAVGFELGMSAEEIMSGLKKFENADMRQNIYELGGITVIEDCYNASPESMRAAIDVLKTVSKSKKGSRMTALLGDMRELGDNSKEFHKEVGRYFGSKGGKLLMTMGMLARDIAFGALEGGLAEKNVYIITDCNNVERIGDTLLDILKEGDILLVKASRAVGAERVVEYIKTKLGK